MGSKPFVLEDLIDSGHPKVVGLVDRRADGGTANEPDLVSLGRPATILLLPLLLLRPSGNRPKVFRPNRFRKNINLPCRIGIDDPVTQRGGHFSRPSFLFISPNPALLEDPGRGEKNKKKTKKTRELYAQL